MIILDTNVLSELMKPAPDERVVAWVNEREDLFITAVTAAGLLHGVARMPAGQRRSRIAGAVAGMLEDDFADRVLAFDLQSSVEYAHLVASREALGRPIGMADAMIAAIAVSSGADVLATRNVKDFDGTGVVLYDPWAAS